MTTTPSEPVNLLPCPFCGDTNTPFFANVVLRDMDFIYCPACRCRGPHRKTETEAIAAWNTRTRPTLPADAVEAAVNAFCDVFSDGNALTVDDMPNPAIYREAMRAALSAALPRDLQGLGHKESCELLGVPLHLASCACARDPQGLVEALRKQLTEAVTKQENDRTMWTPEWQIWAMDARAALAAWEAGK